MASERSFLPPRTSPRGLKTGLHYLVQSDLKSFAVPTTHGAETLHRELKGSFFPVLRIQLLRSPSSTSPITPTEEELALVPGLKDTE